MKDETETINITPINEYRIVSQHEKEETQKEIAKYLKNISLHTWWISIFIGLGVFVNALAL